MVSLEVSVGMRLVLHTKAKPFASDRLRLRLLAFLPVTGSDVRPTVKRFSPPRHAPTRRAEGKLSQL